jgi:hypothetical protein
LLRKTVRLDTDHAYVGSFLDRLRARDEAKTWLRMPDADLAAEIERVHTIMFSPFDPDYYASQLLFGNAKPPPSTTAVRRAFKVICPLPEAYWNNLQKADAAAIKREQEFDPVQAVLDEIEDDDEAGARPLVRAMSRAACTGS